MQNKICYVTDVEGDYDHFMKIIKNSEGLYFEKEELKLREDFCFIHGGDLFDRGNGDIRLSRMLVELKRKYGDRVILLLGNRDINKMRFTSELDMDIPKEKAFNAFWDPSAPNLVEYLERNKLEDSKLNRLKFILTHTLGCPRTFEYRREELSILNNKQDIDDQQVLQNFIDSVEEDEGIYTQYLKVGQLACILGNTLFVHGAADIRGLSKQKFFFNFFFLIFFI